MPTDFLVSTAIEDARVRAGFPTITATTFINTTDVLGMAIESAQRLSGIVRATSAADFFETQSDVSTSIGVANIALPANCHRLLRAVWVKGPDDFVEIARASRRDMNDWSGGWGGRTPQYRLRSNGINFFPTPGAVETVRLYYDTGIIITSTLDTIAGEPGWREWLTLDLCVKFRTAEEKDWSEFAAQKIPVEKMMADLAPRDRAGITQVVDVDNLPIKLHPWNRL